MKKYFLVFSLLAVCIGALICYQLIVYSDKFFHVVVCDVGQGDGIYIRTPEGFDVVVDAGPGKKMLECLSDHMPFWDRSIDLVFLTHGHRDHADGIVEIFSRYDVDYFVTQEDLGVGDIVLEVLRKAEEEGIEIRYVSAGNKLRVGESEIDVLWPSVQFLAETDDSVSSFDENSSSLTLLVTYREVDFLLTGDVQEEVVREAVQRYDPEVVKLAHHGSRTGTGEDTFVLEKPELAFISLGKDNSYGHPHASVMEALERARVPSLRTDEWGSIEVVSDGRKFWVEE